MKLPCLGQLRFGKALSQLRSENDAVVKAASAQWLRIVKKIYKSFRVNHESSREWFEHANLGQVLNMPDLN